MAVDSARAWWLLAALVVLVYCGAFSRELVFDAAIVVGADPRLQALNGENLRNLWTQQYWWPTLHSDAWRPLTNTTFMVEYAVLGFRDHPLGYQVVNALLHTLNAGLVWTLGLALGLRRAVAFGGAALFAAHPLGTEAVANIVGRSDLLATAGVLGGLVLVLRPSRRPRGEWRRWLGVAGCGVLAVLGKENGIVLFGIVVGLALIRACDGRDPAGNFGRRRPWREHLGPLVATLPALALFVGSRLHFSRFTTAIDNIFVDNPLHELGFVAGRLTALRVLADNVRQFFVPVGLSADYSFDAIPLARGDFSAGTDQIGWATLVGLVVFGALVAWRVRRDPVVAFLAGAAFTAYFPTSNLVMNIGSIRADRFMYLPLAFLAPLVAVLAARLWALTATRADFALLRRALPPAVAVWAAAIAVLAHVRGHDWRDNYMIWDSAVAVVPNSFKAVAARGRARLDLDRSEQSLRATVEDYRQGLAVLEERGVPPLLTSVQAYGDYAAALVKWADYLAEAGRWEEARQVRSEAESVFRRALQIEDRQGARWLKERRERGLAVEGDLAPMNNLNRRNLAGLLIEAGRADEAVEILTELVKRFPFDWEVRRRLVRGWVALEQWQRATEERVLMSIIEPGDEAAAAEIRDLLAATNPWAQESAGGQRPRETGVRLNLDDPAVGALVREGLRRYRELLARHDNRVEAARIGRIARLRFGLEIDDPR